MPATVEMSATHMIVPPENMVALYDHFAEPVFGKLTPAHLMIYAAARRAGNRSLWIAMMQFGW